ncbi:MAG: hypothetical protein AAB250_01995, partial [Bdellovibrionota bacterium]
GVVLLLRQLGQKDEGGQATKVEAKIDADAIESAMKRALAAQGSGAAQPAPVIIDGGDNEAMTAALREREARIAELQSEIAKLRADIDNVQSLTGMALAGGGSEIDSAKLAELEGKIDELKGRLQEYEIIEDDIADLSLYKDENARLKHEIKRLREEAPEATKAVPTHEEELALLKASADAGTETPAVEEPADDGEDDVMKQFASAVQVQKAPPPVADTMLEANPFEGESPGGIGDAPESDSPLAFELDPEKIMSEVSSLEENADDSSALEETLDTDKLLAEVGSLGGSEPVAAPQPEMVAAPVAAAAAPAPTPAPAAVVASPAAAPPSDPRFDPLPPEVPAVDDLLAEFKETKS